MRWNEQLVTADAGVEPTIEPALPGMPEVSGRIRVVRTPEFAGVTFHEVNAKSALNRVPGASQVPFEWTVNPYRGCTHACVYCFARGTHTYLEFDSGNDFDTQIVVKVNVAEVLRRELSRPSWRRDHVALGTNTDPYQRAEGRYRLMPGIIGALGDSGTPFSILTKGTVLSRDLPLLSAAPVPVGIAVSLAVMDPQLQATLEPGTPGPRARLDLIKRITDAGLPCSVLVAPILPYLTDSPDQLGELVDRLAGAGVTGVSGIALHLRPGAREWFFGWLDRERPDLVPRYRALYRRGSYADKRYREQVAARLSDIVAAAGIGRRPTGYRELGPSGPSGSSGAAVPIVSTEAEQLTLL